MTKDQEYWIFGYGSLIFKPPLYYDLRVPGYINGYVRRFWQSSNDHRGTPSAPGRVVTLIDYKFWSSLSDPHPGPDNNTTWGVAYRIRADKVEEARAYLDYREKNGYTVDTVELHFQKTGVITDGLGNTLGSAEVDRLPDSVACTVYIGTPENEAFTGPQDPDELAAHILKSRGPSGENSEYLFKLAEALKILAPESEDFHIEELVTKVKLLESKQTTVTSTN
jgi:glutathione-specific gamma-glutamylcyclotransferase